GSAVLRRCALLPASVYTPECSQLPHIVVPSSRSCANPSTCCPAALMSLVGSLSSLRSASALPFISFSASPRSGLCGFEYDHARFRIGSGNVPPSFLYSAFTASTRRPTISWSALASPGGSVSFHFHCSQRAELVNVPSFSANDAAGRRNTSVWIFDGSAPSYSLGAFQNCAVSVSWFSTTTIHFSLDSAATIFFEFGPSPTGFMPNVMKPSGPGSLPPARVACPRSLSSNLRLHQQL